jgi:hypothetical protein
VTRCQGGFLHITGCVLGVPLVCRSLAGRRVRVREDLSDQGLPIIEIARTASEALPCEGNALISDEAAL